MDDLGLAEGDNLNVWVVEEANGERTEWFVGIVARGAAVYAASGGKKP